MKTRVLSLALAMVLVMGGTAFSRTTRDLVFEDEEPAAQSAPSGQTNEQSAGGTASGTHKIAVKTTVVLVRDGKTSTVAPSHEFQSGDKVKLVFTPNIDGYVYWLAKGTSGNYQMLFPSAKAGADNQVKRNVEYTVPASGSFRFDDTAGKEELLCILSRERLSDLDSAAAQQFAHAQQQVAALQENHATKRTTRDLVFEEEESADVSTKQQEAPKGEPFVAAYVLTHK